MKKLLIILLLCQASPFFWRGVGCEVCAQDQNLIDSLQLELKNHNTLKLELGKKAPVLYDTTKANILYELSKSYRNSDPTKSIDYANQLLMLSQQILYKKGIGNAYFTLGLSYYQKGEFAHSLEDYAKSFTLRTEIDDKIGMALCLNNIGNVYFSLGSFPQALQNHLMALKVRETINDENGIAGSYNNIGMIYMMQGSYALALNYFNRALKINSETGNKSKESSNLENIGCTYILQQNYAEALKYFNASFKILEHSDDLYKLQGNYLNKGDSYFGMRNYSQALNNYFNGLKIATMLEDKEGQAISNASIGTVYMKQGEYKLASEFLSKGLALAKEIGGLETMKKCYDSFASLDSAQGNLKQALAHYKLFIATRDNIYNQDNTNKTTALQLQYDAEKKEKQITLLTKESKLQQTELQKQSTSRNLLIIACILIALLSGIIYNRYRTKQKANAAIEKTLHHLKSTQEQLIEREKLASLGKFTAEVAREIEVPVKEINQLTKVNRTLIQNIKNANSIADAEALKNNLLHIFNYGKEADAVVKKVLTETRKVQG